jgi:hypothetical protein
MASCGSGLAASPGANDQERRVLVKQLVQQRIN